MHRLARSTTSGPAAQPALLTGQKSSVTPEYTTLQRNFVRTHVAGGAALGCFLDHCWSSVGQTMHTGNVESMSQINNDG